MLGYATKMVKEREDKSMKKGYDLLSEVVAKGVVVFVILYGISILSLVIFWRV